MLVQSSPFCLRACCFYWYHHFSKRTAMYFWAAKRILDSRVIGLLLHSLRVVVFKLSCCQDSLISTGEPGSLHCGPGVPGASCEHGCLEVVVGVKILSHMKKMMNNAFLRDRLCRLRGLGHQASEDCFVFIVAHIAPHYTRFRSLGRRNLFKLGVPAHTVRISKGIASPVALDRLCSCWLQADC